MSPRSCATVLTLLIFLGRLGAGAGPAIVTTPEVVARGRPPGVRACSSCHLPNGFGRPETASLAGQPAVYIEEQMANYRRGGRKSAEADGPAGAMRGIAVAASEIDVGAAAEYYAAIPYAPWIRVVEAEVLPEPRSAGTTALEVGAGGVVPIGKRIIEVPSTDAPGYVAYVPVGSIRRGETLVTTGAGGRTVRCALCHGDELRGLGPVPGIAGRSPSYQVRQLRDMQRGVRQGLGADLMKATVARLSESDMMAIAAYTASQRP